MLTQEQVETAQDYTAKFADLSARFDMDGKRFRMEELEAASTESSVWSNPEKSKEVGKELGRLKNEVSAFALLAKEVGDLNDAIEILKAGEDAGIQEEFMTLLAQVGADIEAAETKTYL